MVVLITALGRGATPGTLATEIAVAAVFFAVLVAGFYVTTTYVLPRAYWAVLLLRNREILILLATLMALAAMWTAHLLSVSPALGAFIAGMLLAESPFAAQIRSDIGTLRVIFVTLFFTSVGMLADIPWILQNWAIVLAAVVLVIFLKSVIIGVIMRGYGQPLAQSVATGICLAQIGEFSFMLAEIGLQVGAITEQVYSQAVSVSVVTLLLTPLLVSNAPRAGWAAASRRKRGGNGGDSSPAALPQTPAVDGMVLIIGFGPAGQSVANSMREAKVPFLVVELNPATVAQARREGMLAEVGDATHEEVLRHLEVARARAVVLTLPDHRAGLDIVRTIHGFAPGVPLIVRSRYHRFAKDFTDAGATFVIDEEIQVGIFLGELLARGLTRRLL
jgi:CPA2 family monovalent cation:H+ antiporter-2